MNPGNRSQGAPDELTESTRFELLSDGTRRELLGRLLELGNSEEPSVGELAGRVAREERRQAVEAELHHVHLPKLDEVGVVEYDPRERTVSITDRIRAFEPHL